MATLGWADRDSVARMARRIVPWDAASAVHLLFVDESGKPSDRDFAIGGVAIHGTRWHELRSGWSQVLSEHGWPDDREIKWHGIQTGEVPPALADALFAALAAAPVTCFVVVLRTLAARKEFRELVGSDEQTYTTALKFLVERFQRWLSRHDGHGAVVLDSRLPHLDNRLRRYYERLQREGTEYVRLERLVDALLLGPSHHSIGLQTADLVVASTRAARGRLGDASRWHRQLEHRFARHPDTGEVAGVGKVVWPREPGRVIERPGKLFPG
jgi:hypothetical protein